MIKIKDIGNFESIPQILSDIIDGNIPALNDHLSQGWDIEEEIKIGKRTSQTPLGFALIMESFDSVKWLVEHGANLNATDNPSFLIAVRYCEEEIIRYVAEYGAKVNGVNRVKSEAFQQALYGKRYENLPLIHALGHTVQKYGGEAFRSTVGAIGFDRLHKDKPRDDKKYDALDFFIEHSVDVNYKKANSVYPFKPTPLCVAARYVDLQMCKYLVEHGADVTLAESGGMRPYSIAVERGDLEMAAYFKSLEPAEFHNVQNKLDELKPYKLPKTLINFLQNDNLHLDLQDCGFKFIDFFPLVDTVPMKIDKQKLLRISKKTGDYDHIIFVWNPKSKLIACYDTEHEKLQNIAPFNDFISNASNLMQKVINGDFE